MQTTINVPVKAHYKVIDGRPVLQSAEYADVDPKAIAEMILRKMPSGANAREEAT